MKSRLPALMIMNRHDLGTLCSLYAFISQIFQSQTLYKNQTWWKIRKIEKKELNSVCCWKITIVETETVACERFKTKTITNSVW